MPARTATQPAIFACLPAAAAIRKSANRRTPRLGGSGERERTNKPSITLEGETMANSMSGPVQAVRGIVEGVLGKVKEVVGTLIGRNDLINEGEAQQDKADAQRDAGRKEAEAEKARGKAKLNEQRERAEQQ
jgi:uncharacterized protein YjbJ (UPF0337 family)